MKKDLLPVSMSEASFSCECIEGSTAKAQKFHKRKSPAGTIFRIFLSVLIFCTLLLGILELDREPAGQGITSSTESELPLTNGPKKHIEPEHKCIDTKLTRLIIHHSKTLQDLIT